MVKFLSLSALLLKIMQVSGQLEADETIEEFRCFGVQGLAI